MASDLEELYSSPTWKILKRRPICVEPVEGELIDFGDPGYWLTQVLRTYPGSNKSWAATQFVTEAWEKRRLKGLYLMLSHPAIDERMDKIREDGNEGIWTRWRAHAEDCERKVFNDKGYFGSGWCECREKLKAEGPTLAPIEYILPRLPGQKEPLVEAAGKFDFWIVDEMDFRRLLGYECVGMQEVRVVADTHPDKSVKLLCRAMCDLADGLGVGQRVNGNQMYDMLAQVLKAHKRRLPALGYRLQQAELTMEPWTVDGNDLPRNFPPVLVPIVVDELFDWENGQQITPRIHIERKATGAELRVWWRKELTTPLPDEDGFPPDTFFPPYTFILDATGDERLLGSVYGDSLTYIEKLAAPLWPDNVYVYQWSDDMVSRQGLGIRKDTGTFSARSVSDRQRWYKRIADALADRPRQQPIGIITHKAIEDEAKKALEDMGFQEVRSLYYGDERGSNTLEDVGVLVLLGLPIPNLDGFKEEAQGFLQYDNPRFDWEYREQFLEMRNGEPTPVTVGGYWKGMVARYYRQKCQFGLYQALHRIRPYIPKDYDRYIYIFTNMPVPGVTVDGLLRTKLNQQIDAREERAHETIIEVVDERGFITVPELAERIALDGENVRTVAKWVERHVQDLAEKSDVVFEPGHPGRFLSRISSI